VGAAAAGGLPGRALRRAVAGARRTKPPEPSLFDSPGAGQPADSPAAAWSPLAEAEFTAGRTTLDRVHQAMLLFGAGRSDALRRFLVEEGAGRDERYWHLAQALSALYPAGSEEKRWMDGVLVWKKRLGL
jgi:hypothetical protein